MTNGQAFEIQIPPLQTFMQLVGGTWVNLKAVEWFNRHELQLACGKTFLISGSDYEYMTALLKGNAG